MKLNFIHACDTAFLSASGNLNIIGIFERILAPKLPAIHSRLTVVANVEGSPGEYDFEVKITDEQSNLINSLRGNFTLDASRKKFGIISSINNLRFKQEGIYSVELFVDTKKIGETNFELRLIEAVS